MARGSAIDEATVPSAAHSAGEDAAARRVARSHNRAEETRASVVYGERIAKWVITVGGLLVILAVIGIMVFLFRVVLPLMGGGRVVSEVRHGLDAREVAWLNGDAFQSLAIRVGADGRATTFHIPTGRVVKEEQLDFAGATAIAVGGMLNRDRVAFGVDDGTVRFGQVGFELTTTARRNAPPDLIQLYERHFLSGDSIPSAAETGDFRTVTPVKTVGEPEMISEAAIVALDYRVGGTVERLTRSCITVDALGIARLSRSVIQRNLMTGAKTVRTSTAVLPALDEGTVVTAVLLASAGDRAIIATKAGLRYRDDARDPNNPILPERRRVFARDFKAWTNGALGTGTPFMTFLLWPLWSVVVGAAFRTAPRTAPRTST